MTNLQVEISERLEETNMSFEQKGSISEVIKSEMKEVASKYTEVIVYNAKDRRRHWVLNNSSQLVVFVGATPNEDRRFNDHTMVDPYTPTFSMLTGISERMIDSRNMELINIETPEGQLFAQFDEQRDSLYILFDLFGMSALDMQREMFKGAFESFVNQHLVELQNRNSWVHTNDREALLRRAEGAISTMYEREIRSTENAINEAKQRLENYRNEVTRWSRNLAINMAKLDGLQFKDEEGAKKVIKELDLIAGNDKVENVELTERTIEVYTKPLYAHTQDGRRYYMGEYKVVIKLGQADVRFYNPNGRKGYWTSNDPHPHVDGDNGNPCWGNVSSAIAELSSQNELYAIAVTSINYLESVNTEDIAGKYVEYWDQVDEAGTVIKEGLDPSYDHNGEEYTECENCGELNVPEDDYNIGFMRADPDDGVDPNSEVVICEECREDNFYYSDFYNETVHEDVDEGEED